MYIASRQNFWLSSSIDFLEYVQSDGYGIVDTGFTPTNPSTRIIVTAAYSQSPSYTSPLVWAGDSIGINTADSKIGFGFAPVYSDRQLYIRVGNTRWWNSIANTGNWNDGVFHTIQIERSSSSAASCILDGSSVNMVNEGSSSGASTTMPSESQVIFGSHYDGQYYLANSLFKVHRVAYMLENQFLADFRAARKNGVCGFFDIVSNEFHPGTNGNFTTGSKLYDNNYSCNLNSLSCIPINIPINGLGDVSYGGWIRNMPNYTITPSWNDSGSWGGTYFGANSNTVECRFGSGSSNTKQQWSVNPSIMADTWTHIYFTRNGSTMNFYVNGVAQTGLPCGTGVLTNNANTFWLTKGFTSTWLNTNFSTMGLAFFSRALSQSEIQTAMNDVIIDTSKTPYNSGLVMGINCNEGAGSIINELVTKQQIVLNPAPIWNVDRP